MIYLFVYLVFIFIDILFVIFFAIFICIFIYAFIFIAIFIAICIAIIIAIFIIENSSIQFNSTIRLNPIEPLLAPGLRKRRRRLRHWMVALHWNSSSAHGPVRGVAQLNWIGLNWTIELVRYRYIWIYKSIIFYVYIYIKIENKIDYIHTLLFLKFITFYAIQSNSFRCFQ